MNRAQRRAAAGKAHKVEKARLTLTTGSGWLRLEAPKGISKAEIEALRAYVVNDEEEDEP